MPYNEKYNVITCSKSGIPIKIVLSKKENNPPIGIPEKLSVIDFKIRGKKTDSVTEPINGSELNLVLLSSATFNADVITTEDEREWRTDIYYNNDLYWSGFHLPEGLSEPYSNSRYNISINANDAIGNLKTIPYSDGVVYTGFASDKDIIVKCLAKTGLDLPIVIGVNMFEQSMVTTICPLVQSTINQVRFLDKSNKPFSCHEVLRSILERYGAKICQAKGAWYIVNTLEQTEGPVKGWRFTSAGVSQSAITINDTVTAGATIDQAPILFDNHNISKDRAFKSALAYYQYGFISNGVSNGNFNNVTNGFFTDWERLNNVNSGIQIVTETNLATGEVVETGKALIIYEAESSLGQIVRSTSPVQIRANEKARISFNLVAYLRQNYGYFSNFRLEVVIKDENERHYKKNGWSTVPGSYDIELSEDDLDNYKTNNIEFELPPLANDYQIIFGFSGLRQIQGSQFKIEAHYDNLNIETGVADAALNPAIGSYTRLTQTKNLTYIPEPIVLLHGDENNNLRTSQIRINGLPTAAWNRSGRVENKPLLEIVADSFLRLNSKPKKIFDATFSSKQIISPLSKFIITQIAGTFHCNSGDFDLLNEEYVLTLFEGLNSSVNVVIPIENGVDTGNLKDQTGQVISPPTGVSNPPNPGTSPGGNGLALTIEDGYIIYDGDKINAGYADEAFHSLTADDAVLWEGHAFGDFIDQPVKSTSDVEFASIETDLLQSKLFVSGVTGSGYRITPDGAEFDNITVRKTLNVTTLNIREITGSGGSLAITNVAKISAVTDMGSYWKCDINTDDGTIAVQLRTNDLVRCQVWDGKGIKYYVTRVTSISTESFNLSKSDKVGSGIPARGDSVFQFGNTTDTARQGLLYLTNSDSGAPYLDVLDGINTDSLAGKTKVRLGQLNGINDPDLGQLDGYGLYAERAFIKGRIVVTGGNAATLQNLDAAKIEGRNYFKTDTVISNIGTIDNVVTRDKDANKGLSIQGSTSGESIVRLNSVITKNDYWTISFWAMASTPFALAIDVADLAVAAIQIETEWKFYSFTVQVQNYTKEVFHFIDFGNIQNNLVKFNYLMIEQGLIAHDWSPAPEDVNKEINIKANGASTAAKVIANLAKAEAQNAKQTAAIVATKTTFLNTDIDGNVIATGTLLVGGAAENNAGITGVTDEGLSSVRFYAGNTYANKTIAPYRVLQDGSLYSTKGYIGGFKIGINSITAADGVLPDTTGSFVDQLNIVYGDKPYIETTRKIRRADGGTLTMPGVKLDGNGIKVENLEVVDGLTLVNFTLQTGGTITINGQTPFTGYELVSSAGPQTRKYIHGWYMGIGPNNSW